MFCLSEELYRSLKLDKSGYALDEAALASPCDMNTYYSKEGQILWGVCDIETVLEYRGFCKWQI